MTNPFYAEIYNLPLRTENSAHSIFETLSNFVFLKLSSEIIFFSERYFLTMSGLSVMRIVRPAMRGLMGSPQLQSQMVVRMMSSQKELQYIKVDTTG